MVSSTQLSPALPFLISFWNSFWGHLLLIHLASFWFSVLSLHLPLRNFLTRDFKPAYCFDNLRSVGCIWLTKHSHTDEGLRKYSICQESPIIPNTCHPSSHGHYAVVISAGKALCWNATRQTKLCFYKSAWGVSRLPRWKWGKRALSVVSKKELICNVDMSERDEPNSSFSLDHNLLLIHECEKI